MPSRTPIPFITDAAPLAPPDSFPADVAALGIELEPGDVDRLGRFLAILLANNDLLNLTAITDPAEAWTKHILDALTLLPLLAEIPDGGRIADVGSGGGVPAIPLALVLPRLSFTLIEATAKKTEFLSAAAAALGIQNIEIVNDRAEPLGQDHKNYRESFDAVIARALGRLNVAAELTVPLCRVGVGGAPGAGAGAAGRVILVKGQKAEEELAEARHALKILGAVHAGTLETPTGRLVVLDKVHRTPRIYPRPAGEPKRKPLA